MNSLEHELHYPLGDTLPALGETIEVATGVRWLRVGLPFALNHINLWLLADNYQGKRGWAIVDCGIASPATREAWAAVTASLDGPITRVIATHMHPDHIGNARWLCDTHGVQLFCSMTDYIMARALLATPSGSGGELAAAHFAAHGLNSPADIEKIKQRGTHFSNLVDGLPTSFARLMDGQTLNVGANDWQLISGYGHSPEHISLYCATLGVCISGDMLLPRVSTNVSVWDMEPEGNPLPLFLAGIERFAFMPEATLVLPSHGKPFHGIAARLRQLREHHRDRLDDVLQACKTGPKNAVDIVKVLFNRELDLHQMTFALGESLAHLHALWYEGKLSRSKNAAGVWEFRA